MVQLHRVQPGELGVGGGDLKSACTWTLKRGEGDQSYSPLKKKKKKRSFLLYLLMFWKLFIYVHV